MITRLSLRCDLNTEGLLSFKVLKYNYVDFCNCFGDGCRRRAKLHKE